MVALKEEEVDQYRKELVDIDRFLSIPSGFINEAIEGKPSEQLEEDHFKDILTENVL